jgi:hypothetical protein
MGVAGGARITVTMIDAGVTTAGIMTDGTTNVARSAVAVGIMIGGLTIAVGNTTSGVITAAAPPTLRRTSLARS